MGCCVSSIDKKNPPPPPPHLHKHSSFSKSSSSRAPPPPPPLPLEEEEEEEEETVKEVLSETPNPKPSSYLLSKIEHEPRKIPPRHEIQSPVKNNGFIKPSSNSINPNPTADEVSEEVSEICSESVSTTTTAFNNDVSGEIRRRSPAKYRNNNRLGSGELSRERAVGKSPARGSVQSPGRVRSMNGRDSRRVVAARGESSGPGNRSGSPANRTGGGGDGTRNGVGRSSSVRKTGKSPGRVGSDLNRRGEPMKNTNESLENPLVSLECFIFL